MFNQNDIFSEILSEVAKNHFQELMTSITFADNANLPPGCTAEELKRHMVEYIFQSYILPDKVTIWPNLRQELTFFPKEKPPEKEEPGIFSKLLFQRGDGNRLLK